MDIVQYISTPKNTTQEAPLATIIKLTKGRLTGGALYFPAGPAGNLHFVALVGIHQIIPFNASQNIRLDNCVLPLTIGIDLEEPPFELVCKTWNDSTLYDHALTLLLSLTPAGEGKEDINSLIDRYYYGRDTGLR